LHLSSKLFKQCFEEKYVSAEEKRASTEGKYVSAEEKRASTEGKYVSAEEKRAGAEGKYVSAEEKHADTEMIRGAAKMLAYFRAGQRERFLPFLVQQQDKE
jgi:hypothetical protein